MRFQPGDYPVIATLGVTFELEFLIQVDGGSHDLVAYDAPRIDIKQSRTSETVLFTKAVSVNTPATGWVRVSLTIDDLDSLGRGSFHYSIYLSDTSTDPDTVDSPMIGGLRIE